MRDAEILEWLLDLAREAGIEVRVAGPGAASRDETLASGVCRVRGRVFVVLSSAEPIATRIAVLAGALRRHAAALLEARHLPPAVRARLEPGEEPACPSA